MRYDDDDNVTFYFVVKIDKSNKSSVIQGWTDKKAIAEYYMQFHKCPLFKMKTMTDKFSSLITILEENNNDEIELFNVLIRNPKGKPGKEFKYVSVPMTKTEYMFVNEESQDFMASAINYSFLDSAIPYLKPKYRRGVEQCLLSDVIRSTIHNKTSDIITEVGMDNIQILLQLFRENFGT